MKAFQVTFDKAWNVDLAKEAIASRREDLFPSVALDLYKVDIPSKKKERLREYKPEDVDRLEETDRIGIYFSTGYKEGHVQIIIQKPGK